MAFVLLCCASALASGPHGSLLFPARMRARFSLPSFSAPGSIRFGYFGPPQNLTTINDFCVSNLYARQKLLTGINFLFLKISH